MYSSSWTGRTATTTMTTSTTTTFSMTMSGTTAPTHKMAATVFSISGTSGRPSRPAADAGRERCWCGQDMDVVHGTHCPRCGTTRTARVGARGEARGGAVLARLAA